MTAAAGGVHPGTDQEHVGSWALNHKAASVPVVDAHGRFRGAVPPLALLAVLRHEHVEDLHRLAGIRRETKHARAALESAPARRARDRLPWLLVGLVGSTLSAILMARFEAVLQARIAVAFFIPGIVYLADAIGTQTEAIAVRGLSLTEAPLRRLMWGELKTGILIGGTLGVLSLCGVLLGFRDIRLGLAVATTVLAAGITATAVGIGFPAVLARLGRDPAFGSGPLATIIQDVLTLLIYFAALSILIDSR
jgi:magnesium transporter